jgi:hypothetical protein
MNRRTLLKNTAMLLGGLLSSSVTRAVLAGVDGRVGIERPVFTGMQKEKCAVLTEMIIPTTDTPGAIAAGVPHFVELMVSDWYTPREREIFFMGLETLDQCSEDRFGIRFLEGTADQRIALLEQAEEDAEQYKPPAGGSPLRPQEDEEKPFFQKIKELTVLGYYTSEIGAKQELSYLPMPMKYGDIELAEVGRQWSS